MAAGEYVSMAAQRELLERELEVERRALAADPVAEREELAARYRSRGVPENTANEVASELMQEPDVALEVHAREELGVDPESLGSPYGAAASSLLAFAVGGLIPLLPWFFARGTEAVVASVVLAGLAALGIGAAIGVSTGRGIVRSALRQLLVGAIAGATTYAIGAVLGVQVS
jgi:VIT1/CCC1 family predicted Fe2+/Mn2+ transporter